MAIDAAQLRVLFTSDGAERVKGDLRDVGQSVDRAGSGFDRLRNGALGLGTALIAPMGIGLKAAVDLEQGIANINASLGGLDPGTLDQLADSFNDIGAASQYSATEVAAVADSLAKAGYGAEDLLNGMTQAVVNLSQATGDGLGPATEGIITAMSIWKEGVVDTSIAMTDASRVADILTIAANESSAGLTDIQAGMRSLGPVAAMMQIPYEHAAAAIALFTNNGLKGADAGISLARGLQNLADPTSEAATWMNELGIAAFDMNGTFVGFPELFRQLQTSMAGLDDQTKFTALSTIFGAEAMDVMGLAILNGADPLETMIALMGESGAAAEQSALRMDTLGAQFDTLKEGVTTFLGSLLQGLIPGLRFLVDGANAVIDVLMQIPGPIKTIIGAVAGGLAAFAAFTRAIQAFQAIDIFLGGTGAFKLPIGPVLALTAAIGGLYLAWQTNFLGIRDITDNVMNRVVGVVDRVQDGFRGAQKFVDRFRDAFRKVEKPVDGVADAMSALAKPLGSIGDVAGKVKGVFDTFTSIFSKVGEPVAAVAGAMEGISGHVNGVASAFTRMYGPVNAITGAVTGAAQAVSTLGRFFDALSVAIRGINGGDIPDWLSSIALAFQNASVLADRFMEVFNQIRSMSLLAGANPFEAWVNAFRGAADAINLGNLAVRVGGWIIDAAVDLGSAVWDWVTGTALPAVGSFLVTLGSVAVSIGGWVISAAQDLWSAIKNWSFGGTQGDGTGGPNAPAVGGLTIASVVVSILGWAVSALGDLWSAVSDAAHAAWNLVGGNYEEVGPLNLRIGDFNVELDTAALMQRLDEETLLDDSTGEMFRSSGETFGQNAADRFFDGVMAGFNTGGGGEGGSGGGGWRGIGGGGGTPMSNAVNEFFAGFLEGAEESLFPQFNAWGSAIQSSISEAWEGLWSSFTLPAATISTVAFDDLSTLSDSIFESFNTWGDTLKIAIPEIWNTFWDAILPDVSIDMPSIDWPDLPEPPGWLTSPPEWLSALARGDIFGAVKAMGSGSANTGDADDAVYGGSGGGGMGTPAGGGFGNRAPIGGGIMPLQMMILADTAKAEAAIVDLAAMANSSSPTVPVNADTSRASGEVASLGASLAATAITIPVELSIAQQAGAALGGAASDIFAGLGIDDETVTITITADNSAAMQAMGDVSAGMAGIDGMSSTVVLMGDNGAALASIDGVSGAMGAIDGMTSTIFIEGNNSGAMAAIEAIQAYNGVVLSTSYHDIVTRQIGGVSAGASAGAGFLAGWDQATGTNSPSREMDKRGQYLFQGLDNGWNRESQQLPVRFDVPNAPYSGYGTTSGESANRGTAERGGDVVFDLSGATFIGTNREEMRRFFAEEAAPMLKDVIAEERRGQVGT